MAIVKMHDFLFSINYTLHVPTQECAVAQLVSVSASDTNCKVQSSNPAGNKKSVSIGKFNFNRKLKYIWNNILSPLTFKFLGNIERNGLFDQIPISSLRLSGDILSNRPFFLNISWENYDCISLKWKRRRRWRQPLDQMMPWSRKYVMIYKL